MELFRFEKLQVWQNSRNLVKTVYNIIDGFPATERYALCDQIRRAIISVPSNIAEGMGRTSNKDKAHFLEIAYGSLMETYCQLIIAADLRYIPIEIISMTKPQFEEIGKMLSGLRKYYLQSNSQDIPRP